MGTLAAFCALLSACSAANDDGDGDGSSGENETPALETEVTAEGVVQLSETQRQLAGIATEVLTPRPLAEAIRAPGEAILNAYATAQVTPRIQAQVVARHAKLGDRVERDQRLVTLSSVEMADAQGALVVTDREWRRVQDLGREVVSERRFVEAQVAAQQARATALAFGMTPEQINGLLANSDANLADGRLTLLAPQQGTVIKDDFLLGEMIDPGRVLFEITDESMRWVEARLSPQEASPISVDDAARIDVGGESIDGRVIQLHQAVDEATRTLPVRIEVPDPDGRFKPGVFVDVEILPRNGAPALALPEQAVLPTPDGDWEVFVETAPGEYRPVEVTLLGSTGGLARISGVEAGTTVVSEGAFFLQSELGKSGFDVDDD